MSPIVSRSTNTFATDITTVYEIINKFMEDWHLNVVVDGKKLYCLSVSKASCCDCHSFLIIVPFTLSIIVQSAEL